MKSLAIAIPENFTQVTLFHIIDFIIQGRIEKRISKVEKKLDKNEIKISKIEKKADALWMGLIILGSVILIGYF